MSFSSSWLMKNLYYLSSSSGRHRTPLLSSPWPLFTLAYLVLAFMAVPPCQKPGDLSGPRILLIGNLKVPFLASLCQRLQGALLPRVVAGRVIGQFHFLWWDPFKPFCQFLPEGLKSSEPCDRLKCAPPVAVPQTGSWSWSRHLLTHYSVFTVGLVKLVFTNRMPLSLVFSPRLLLWLFCSDLWEMDSTNIIGCLATFSMI